MANRKRNKEFVADYISNLTIPYIEKYGKEILGIYLCPYTIGKSQRIEMVVLHTGNKEVTAMSKPVIIKDYKIYMTTNFMSRYQGKIDNRAKLKLAKELKSSVILYDPKNILTDRKKHLENEEEIEVFYNSFKIPEGIVAKAKNKVRLLTTAKN